MSAEILELAKWVAAVGGALLVVWQLLERAHKLLLSDLAESFASKDDFRAMGANQVRIEEKLDHLTDSLEERQVYRRKRNAADSRTKI